MCFSDVQCSRSKKETMAGRTTLNQKNRFFMEINRTADTYKRAKKPSRGHQLCLGGDRRDHQFWGVRNTCTPRPIPRRGNPCPRLTPDRRLWDWFTRSRRRTSPDGGAGLVYQFLGLPLFSSCFSRNNPRREKKKGSCVSKRGFFNHHLGTHRNRCGFAHRVQGVEVWSFEIQMATADGMIFFSQFSFHFFFFHSN